METLNTMDLATALSDKHYFFRDTPKLPPGWRCDWEYFSLSRMFRQRTTHGRICLNVKLESIYDIPRGAFESIMFYRDLLIFRCSGAFYLWEFTNDLLYDFKIEFASDSIDDFLSHGAIQAWEAGALPPTLVERAEDKIFDNNVFEAKEMEWGRLNGIDYEERETITEEDIAAELGEPWASAMNSW